MLQDSFDQRSKTNRRRAEIFRKGLVSAIDDTVVPPRYTINGRTMPMVQAGVEVGDVVVYVDQKDPFGIGKFAGT